MKKLLAFLGIVAAAGWIGSSFVRAQSPGVNSPFSVVWGIPLDSIKRTYGAVSRISPIGTATDIFEICGASGVQTRVTRILVAGRAAATVASEIWVLTHSANPLSGTSISAAPYSSTFAAAKAALFQYPVGVSPVGSTPPGVVAMQQTYLGNLTTGLPGAPADFTFGNRPASALVLTGPTTCASVNLSGVGVSGNLYDISVEWTEE